MLVYQCSDVNMKFQLFMIKKFIFGVYRQKDQVIIQEFRLMVVFLLLILFLEYLKIKYIKNVKKKKIKMVEKG